MKEQSEFLDFEISLEDLLRYVENKKLDGCDCFCISGSDFGVMVSYRCPEDKGEKNETLWNAIKDSFGNYKL